MLVSSRSHWQPRSNTPAYYRLMWVWPVRFEFKTKLAKSNSFSECFFFLNVWFLLGTMFVNSLTFLLTKWRTQEQMLKGLGTFCRAKNTKSTDFAKLTQFEDNDSRKLPWKYSFMVYNPDMQGSVHSGRCWKTCIDTKVSPTTTARISSVFDHHTFSEFLNYTLQFCFQWNVELGIYK